MNKIGVSWVGVSHSILYRGRREKLRKKKKKENWRHNFKLHPPRMRTIIMSMQCKRIIVATCISSTDTSIFRVKLLQQCCILFNFYFVLADVIWSNTNNIYYTNSTQNLLSFEPKTNEHACISLILYTLAIFIASTLVFHSTFYAKCQ